MPGSDFHTEALATIYSAELGQDGSPTADYSGSTSFAMFAKWQILTLAQADGVARVIDLIFTDVAANGLVGTKSWLPDSFKTPN